MAIRINDRRYPGDCAYAIYGYGATRKGDITAIAGTLEEAKEQARQMFACWQMIRVKIDDENRLCIYDETRALLN
jgi:hypothetical protein